MGSLFKFDGLVTITPQEADFSNNFVAGTFTPPSDVIGAGKTFTTKNISVYNSNGEKLMVELIAENYVVTYMFTAHTEQKFWVVIEGTVA